MTLDVGQRQWTYFLDYTEDELKEQDSRAYQKLTQNVAFQDNGEEMLINTQKKTYTIVGFCSRPSYEFVEPRHAPGYTAYTIYDGGEYDTINAYLTLKNPAQYKKYTTELENAKISSYVTNNRDLLRFELCYQDEFTVMFLGLAVILIVMIIIGSISLIYNTFSISVSERTKQFGILKSIGATKKQMKNSVLFEALVLCVFGVPLGLISGCLGIAITFKALGPSFGAVLQELGDITSIRFVFSPVAIIAAAAIGIMTVVISAYIPARKAIKISPIESIRQSKEIKIKHRSVKISPLTQKLFGFEGMVSAKYFKRSRRKYRVTVLSLFMSVVLFISASSLSAYFTKMVDSEVEVYDYDVIVSLSDVSEEKAKKFTDSLIDSGFDETVFVTTDSLDAGITPELSDASLIEKNKFFGVGEYETGLSQVFLKIEYLSDEVFKKILEENNIDSAGYFDENNPKALIYDNCTEYYIDQETGDYKSYEYRNFDREKLPGRISVCETIIPLMDIEGYEKYEGYYLKGWGSDENGIYAEYGVDEEGAYEAKYEKIVRVPWDKVKKEHTFNVGAVLEETPAYTTGNYDFQTLLVYPESVIPESFKRTLRDTCFITDEDHKAAEKSIRNLMADIGISSDSFEVYNIAASNDSSKAIVLIAKVMAYGFITLISLIAAANVFNTVSANIMLRRRELATLMSIGLTKGGLRKMMFYESLIYGLKSLVFSLPVSTAVTYLIYYIMNDGGADVDFFLPATSYILAVVSVFAVVIVTMAYSMNKISKENIIESLRNENI